MYVKLSILQDVSRAICYLHSLNPPILHGNLTLDNILLTTSLVAKVCDFTNSITISSSPGEQAQSLGKVPGTRPPKAHGYYRLLLDVFSFGCIACDVIVEQITHGPFSYTGSRTPKRTRERQIKQISESSLKQMVIACLNYDQEKCPAISVVSERITSIITG